VSEPFIIAGTALFEPDLEFFMAHRTSNSQILARAPSILLEPYPDAGTRQDCERLQLVLVETEFLEFLDWLIDEFGIPPSPLAPREPLRAPRIVTQSSIQTRTVFWSDFDFVQQPSGERNTNLSPTAFAFGRPPDWDDIRQKRDVPLQSQLTLIDEIRRWASSSDPRHVVCVSARAGSGNSTTIRRVSTDLSENNIQVFFVRATGGLDTECAIRYLKGVGSPNVLATDFVAEHGAQLFEIVTEVSKERRCCIFGAERQYRMELVRELIEELSHRIYELSPWRKKESVELINRYADMGLVANAAAMRRPDPFADQLSNHTVAKSICPILNDFRPLKAIVQSLWNDTVASARWPYLAASLAHYWNACSTRMECYQIC
jgi:hypothetical protein